MDSLLPPDIVDLARQVIEAHKARGTTVAIAESCTGGLVAAALTEIPGSSAVVDRAFVSYSNDAKMEMLSVPLDLIETFGAVSVAVAWSMANGAIKNSQADLAVAITGIAGPDGGSELKPVGTVVFARAEREQPDDQEPSAELRKFECKGRPEVRHQAALCALELLLPQD
ncbi:CinA family protein [Croceicoccus naphthovorans]|uniref:Competence protein n=1 Tax=Croceicoccus naphthovorans TaxID=1348774 RepID=A0A0G3XIA1_9SPHN|nr:CinA family protein [Croceicoccus naphthovorans]AKM10058.1 competence protein [Croceicoccus naphthovorans]MBB3991227.1 nicotinamide-nucleotide amidase [Croceicoccus naphthovorans]